MQSSTHAFLQRTPHAPLNKSSTPRAARFLAAPAQHTQLIAPLVLRGSCSGGHRALAAVLDAIPVLLHPLLAALRLALNAAAVAAAQALGLAALRAVRMLAPSATAMGLAQASRLRRLLAIFERAGSATAVRNALAVRLCALIAVRVRAALAASVRAAQPTGASNVAAVSISAHAASARAAVVQRGLGRSVRRCRHGIAAAFTAPHTGAKQTHAAVLVLG
ncbi:hypothetical protein ON010_g4347 [Phytophthora cinnamomi]|nr:hypothetical protein ON010_g4347 [Phytophthora cinnamomi]